jgi:hypothetical protein
MKNNKAVLFWMFLVISMTQACTQQFGSIDGTVTGPSDVPVQYAAVQATNIENGEKVRVQGAQNGIYDFPQLVPGSYSLKVNMPCCAYQSYESDMIEVKAGEATQIDIQLLEGTSFNTIGDDPGIVAAAVRDRRDIPDLPVPRMLDDRPDLSGVWLVGQDPFPEEPAAQAWAAELHKDRIANQFAEHPHTRCLPGDPPLPSGGTPTLAKFFQKPGLLLILLEDVPGYRQIFLDGREHPEWPNPSWMGHSIGHWEGDVLVVDTVGFNDRGWMFGFPRSEELHLVERYKRTDYGRLEVELTIEDPKVFDAPWKHSIALDLVPQEELIEYVCENNKWAPSA